MCQTRTLCGCPLRSGHSWTQREGQYASTWLPLEGKRNHPESFPGDSDGKEFTCKAGDFGSISGLGRCPGKLKWQPTPVSWPGEFHGQRSLLGYSPWGHKESDMTE